MLIKFLSLFTPVAHASVDVFIQKLNTYIFNPAISLMVFVAVAYFIFGLVEFIKDSDSGEGREKGKRHMMWGLIGLFIMISVFFIMKVLLGTIGISEDQIDPRTGTVNLPL